MRVEVCQIPGEPVVLPDPESVNGGQPGVFIDPDISGLEAALAVLGLLAIQAVGVGRKKLVKVVIVLGQQLALAESSQIFSLFFRASINC